MITNDPFGGNRDHFFGKSTDTKPTDGVPNGSDFVEMDTSKVYFFDAEGESWEEWGGN